jgi:tRNA threonylcarbamoyladenosine biosynthesis protein TsaB
VVVASGEIVLGAERDTAKHGQAERLLPMVDAVMRAASLSPSALSIIGVTIGPGSFTGIRVGLAAARGIALATGAKLIGVSGFEAVAAGLAGPFPSGGIILTVLESRREDIYIQLFDHACDPLGVLRAVLRRLRLRARTPTPVPLYLRPPDVTIANAHQRAGR